jgi:hypothetical protein
MSTGKQPQPTPMPGPLLKVIQFIKEHPKISLTTLGVLILIIILVILLVLYLRGLL